MIFGGGRADPGPARSPVPATGGPGIHGPGDHGPGRPPGPLVLAVTDRQDLAGRLGELAATAGVRFDRVVDLRQGWPGPEIVPLILASADAPLPDHGRHGLVLVAESEASCATWQRAVRLGAEHVAVLPDEETWVLDRILAVTDLAAPAPVIGVIGGTGGAGASALAVAVARAAVERAVGTLLVDTDPFGGGLDLFVGLEREPGLRWSGLLEARGQLRPGLLRGSLPGTDGLSVVSFDRPVPHRPREPPDPAIEAVLRAGRREFELVVLDLGRRLDASVLAAARACTTIVVVVPAQVRAAAATAALVDGLERMTPDLRLVVRGPAPTGLAADDISRTLGLPLLGELRTESSVSAELDRGEFFLRGRGSLSVVARRVVAQVIPA
jgi:secretion/DNA translocation related CpaE-like protein